MNEQEILSFIQRTPLFSDLDTKHIKSIVKTAKQQSYDAGTVILHEGDIGMGFYLILEGQVDIKKGSKLLYKFGQGEFFGEVALFQENSPRSADVIATIDTTCLLITRWDLRATVETHPEIALKFLAELSRRLNATTQALRE